MADVAEGFKEGHVGGVGIDGGDDGGVTWHAEKVAAREGDDGRGAGIWVGGWRGLAVDAVGKWKRRSMIVREGGGGGGGDGGENSLMAKGRRGRR